MTASRLVDESILLCSNGLPIQPRDLHLLSLQVLPHDLCPLPTVCVVTESGMRFYVCLVEDHLQVSVGRPTLSKQLCLRDMWFVGSSILALDTETLVGIVRSHSNPSYYREVEWRSSFNRVLNVCVMNSPTSWKERRSDGSDYLLAGVCGVLYEQNEPAFLVIQPDEVLCLYRYPLHRDWSDVKVYLSHHI